MELVLARLILLISFLTLGVAHAHGPAQWIQDGQYRGQDGLCCGETDCGWISQRDVHATDRGFEVRGAVHVVPPDGKAFTYQVDEIVPYSEAQPSPTGDYWRCAWGGVDASKYKTTAEYMAHADRKCFFSPPPGS